MRRYCFLLIFLIGCSSKNEPADAIFSDDTISTNALITQLRLPFGLNTSVFLKDSSTIIGYYALDKVQVLIYNQDHHETFHAISIGSNGDTIDSISLLDRPAYNGVDSDYTPWIVFSNDFTIAIIDTSIYRNTALDRVTDSTVVLSNDYDTTIVIQTIKISPEGHFVRN